VSVRKDCQLQHEALVQRVGAERQEYAQGSNTYGITPIKHSNQCLSDDFLENIVDKDTMLHAYRKVKANKGAAGIDGMSVHELDEYLDEHLATLQDQLIKGTYQPFPVRRVEIPKKEKDKTRKLGIPTVIDRVIQQAITTTLTHLFEPQFSN